MKINLLELFSGVGGFSLGIEQSGIEIGWHGFSDIDKYANQVFKRRYPNAKELGSVVDINPSKLPRVDLVTFGFPCQDLSIAGRREGFEGSRSSLFFEAMRIIEAKKPKYFIFENVEGIFSSNGGKDFEVVLRTIADIGYDGQWQLLNTRWFLPQNRSRCYFVGHLRGRSRPKVFPVGETSFQSNYGEAKVANCLQHPGHSGGNYKGMTMVNTGLNQIGNIDTKGHNSIWGRVYDTDGVSTTLNAHGGGLGAKTGLYKVHSTQTRNPNRPSLTRECDCGSKKLYQKCCGAGGGSGHLAKDDGTTYCLDSGNTQAVEIESSTIRRLTPRECERLQGFPDDWTEGESDTQRYKMMGNAVSVPVVSAVVERLYEIRTK